MGKGCEWEGKSMVREKSRDEKEKRKEKGHIPALLTTRKNSGAATASFIWPGDTSKINRLLRLFITWTAEDEGGVSHRLAVTGHRSTQGVGNENQ